jgi:diaminopimelate decarboxylase
MFSPSVIARFGSLETPFYYYDTRLLRQTLDAAKKAAGDYHVHYALKANAHPALLDIIRRAGFGADCVSGNEVKQAIASGFAPSSIAFAGVGKTDKEIAYAIDMGIFCFNVESIAELRVIEEIAAGKNSEARIALRVNPNVDAYTHKYITTGLEENKFGINPHEFGDVLELLKTQKHTRFTGIHFHIGSQIQDLNAFRSLCTRANDINQWFMQQGFTAAHLNLGGGLGVDYLKPEENAIVDFNAYFSIFREFLKPLPSQEIHFELGRSLVAQCGSLISRVLFIKEGVNTSFVILDAGMTELMRPALYQAYHKIENISRAGEPVTRKYDVVGPICESSDCFGKAVELPETLRGDLFAIRTAGAYGEVMSNRYNLREALPPVLSGE